MIPAKMRKTVFGAHFIYLSIQLMGHTPSYVTGNHLNVAEQKSISTKQLF